MTRFLDALRWVLATAALVLAAIWWLSVIVGGLSAPDWVPPTALLALALAAVIP
jgi:hypothetical protein